MDNFRDLMYDLIIESLVDKLDNYEITMEDAEIFSEAAYDELYYEGSINDKWNARQDRKFKKSIDKAADKAANRAKRLYGNDGDDYSDAADLIKKVGYQQYENNKNTYRKIGKVQDVGGGLLAAGGLAAAGYGIKKLIDKRKAKKAKEQEEQNPESKR